MKEKMSKLKAQRSKLDFIKKGDAFTENMKNICEVLLNKHTS